MTLLFTAMFLAIVISGGTDTNRSESKEPAAPAAADGVSRGLASARPVGLLGLFITPAAAEEELILAAAPAAAVAAAPTVSPYAAGTRVEFGTDDKGLIRIVHDDVVPDIAMAAAVPEPLAVEETAVASTTPDAASGGMLVVTGSRVNLRDAPTTSGKVVGTLKAGTETVAVGASENGWQRIRLPGSGKEGYMSAKFLAPAAG